MENSSLFWVCRQGALSAHVPVSCHGPVTQQHFLQSLGIEARLNMLEQQSSEGQAQSLREGVKKLLDPGTSKEGGMGTSYKAWAMLAGTDDVPVGFQPAAEPPS